MHETRKPKSFDAVSMMRRARDEISAGIDGMSLQEVMGWLVHRLRRRWSFGRLRCGT
jgi:hypothetical protein